MTIRRGSLYAGAFVLAVGAVTAASVAGPFDRSLASDAVGVLWPVTVIAVGVAVLVRRTRAALPAGFVEAAAPGLLLGGALVGVPSFATPCTGSLSHAPAQTQQGSIDGSGVIDLHLACGELRVTAQPGTGWRLDSSDGPDRRTNVTPRPAGFSATSDGHESWWSGGGPVMWTAVLPTAPVLDLTTQIDAGRAQLDLGGATLRTVNLGVDAGDLRADLADATLDQISLEVNAGSATVTLPVDAFTGAITANAGSVRVCVPAGLGLRIERQESLGSVRINGLDRVGDTWVSGSAAPARTTAELIVNANVGSVTINPEGGCK